MTARYEATRMNLPGQFNHVVRQQDTVPIVQPITYAKPPDILPTSRPNVVMQQQVEQRPIQQPVVKRDPPAFLATKSNNLAASMQTLKLSPIKADDGKQCMQRSLDVPPLTSIGNGLMTKREIGKPPASIAGLNDSSLHLTKMLEKLNKSPASALKSKPTAVNKYMSNKEKENCYI